MSTLGKSTSLYQSTSTEKRQRSIGSPNDDLKKDYKYNLRPRKHNAVIEEEAEEEEVAAEAEVRPRTAKTVVIATADGPPSADERSLAPSAPNLSADSSAGELNLDRQEFLRSLRASINAAERRASTVRRSISNPVPPELPSLVTFSSRPSFARHRSAKHNPHAHRRASILLQHAPMNLSSSQFSLLTTESADPALRSDNYATFLRGPRSVRLDLPRNGFTKGVTPLVVGKGTSGFQVRPSSRKTNVPQQPQSTSEEMRQKWQKLEHLRIKIIATMRSLKFWYQKYQALKDLNKRLQHEHQRVRVKTAQNVTGTLTSIAELNLHISDLRREARKQRRRLARRENKERDEAQSAIDELEGTIRTKEKALQEADDELNVLLAFQKKQPEELISEIQNTRRALEMSQASHSRQIEAMKAKFAEEEHEAEEEVMSAVMECIDLETSKLNPAYHLRLQDCQTTAFRLDREIRIQEGHLSQIASEVQLLEISRGAMRSEMSGVVC
ncbi:hypothetical protein BC832DRAFT_537819 [Gaertneriomyces semiglobifer]|nr:hypothetical protein BC832DRAFT_537819 [Gaertneriomyces semiglobifer]